MGCCESSVSTEDERHGLLVHSNDPKQPLLAEDRAGSESGLSARRSLEVPLPHPVAADHVLAHRRLTSTSPSVRGAPAKFAAPMTRSSSAPTMPLATVTDVPLLSLAEQKLARTLVDLPVATDIPRMVSKIKVVRMPHNSVLFERSNKRDQVPPNAELIRELLRSLSSVLSLDDLNTRIESMFDNYVNVTEAGEVMLKMKPLLSELVQEGNPVSTILKCINQGMLAPAVMKIKLFSAGNFNYKDCRNEWNVDVTIESDESGNTKGVQVSHVKREQSIPEGFEFVWRLDLNFDQAVSQLSSVSLKVIDLSFTTMTDTESQQKIREHLAKAGLDPSVPSIFK